MKDKRYWLILSFTAMFTSSLLSGCSSSGSKESTARDLEAEPPTLAVQDQTPEAKAGEKPGVIEGGLAVGIATVKSIDKKNRVVTLTSPDGKLTKVKCGPEVRNFAQIRVGDDVATTLLETVELFVTGEQKPSAERATEVNRASLGSKPGFSVIDTAEVKAAVVSINYQSRAVTLKGPEGRIIKVKAGPEVKRLNEINTGDTVVARITRAISIVVSKPAKN